MNADRHALLAALEYSAKQEQELRDRDQAFVRLLDENRDLRHRLREARASLDGRDKEASPVNQEAMPPGRPTGFRNSRLTPEMRGYGEPGRAAP